MCQSGDPAFLLPHFYVAVVDVLLCRFDGGFVILAVDAVSDLEFTVRADNVRAVVNHDGGSLCLAGWFPSVY